MTDEELALESVTIRKAPGYATQGFTVEELSPDVNIVHGPNGAGKSTLARCIQAVLWPQSADERTSAVGRFNVDDDEWRVDLASKQARYQRNGSDSNGPTLPSREQRHRYHLSLQDLLQHETRNESFAKRIQQESIGGYDLDSAFEALEFDDSASTRGIKEYQEVENATEEWRQARKNLQSVEADERRLPSLESDLEDAKAAEARIELLEQAIDYRRAENAFLDATDELETYPEVLAEIDGNESEKAREYTDEIEDKRETIDAAEDTKSEAESKLEKVDLPGEGIEPGFIEGLQEQRDELKTAEQHRTQLEGELAKAKERRENARENLPIEVSDEEIAKFDTAAWTEITDFAEQAQRVAAERNAYDAYETWLGDGSESIPDTDVLQRGTNALEHWLAATHGDVKETSDHTLRMAVVSAIVVGVLGAALGFLVNQLLYGTLLVAVGLFLYGYWVDSRGETDTGEARETYRQTFEELDIDGPEDWTRTDIRSQLNDLYTTLAGAKLEEKRKEHLKAVTGDVEALESREKTLEEKRNELIGRYGVAPDTSDIELVAITKGILQWQDADAEVDGRMAELREVESSIEEICQELEDELSEYGYENVAGASDASAHIRNLEKRKENHDKSTRDRELAADEIEAAQEKIDDLIGKRETLFDDVGLEDGDIERLRELCEQVDEYEEAKTEVEKKREVRNNQLEALREYPRYDEELLDLSVAELRERMEQAQETATKREELQEQIREIKHEVRDAKNEYDLEEAVEKRQRKLDALEEELAADAKAMVGTVLVEHLQSRTEGMGRPPVFDRAHELLTTITRGRYRLDIDEDRFRAYDTVKERGFALDELSSGTKLQVLLAVRIAFVEEQEQGIRVPLLLDETLANSDDQRAEVIIQSILELARDGRQVWYFTAQGDEVAKWEQALQTEDDFEHQIIDLADTQEAVDRISIPDLDDLTQTYGSLPDPSEHDHESYREALDVPEFSPWHGAGATHVWYVVEDVEVLDRLLRLGIDTWGQLEALLEQSDPTIVTEEEAVLEGIRLNGTAVNEFVESWMVGRGERVDRQVLEQTAAVTDAFIDDVSELADEVNGDPEAIIDRLRDGAVQRFREDKMDDLEEYLQTEGYIQQRDSLDSATIRTRIVNHLCQYGMDRDDALERGQMLLARLAGHP